MRTLALWRTLGGNDVRLVRRDSLLSFCVIYPLCWGLVVRWLLPFLADRLRGWVDLEPYYTLIVSYLLVLVPPALCGFVVGFLLLDERDDRTLTALRVTPTPLSSYLLYRVMMPTMLSIVMIWFSVPLAKVVSISFPALTAVAVVAAMEAGFFALFLASIASNKVEGFAFMKGLGILPFLPVIAYFVESKWQLLFGILPSYWPAKAFWQAAAGHSDYGLYLAAGFLMHLALLWYGIRRFNRVVLQ